MVTIWGRQLALLQIWFTSSLKWIMIWLPLICGGYAQKLFIQWWYACPPIVLGELHRAPQPTRTYLVTCFAIETLQKQGIINKQEQSIERDDYKSWNLDDNESLTKQYYSLLFSPWKLLRTGPVDHSDSNVIYNFVCSEQICTTIQIFWWSWNIR